MTTNESYVKLTVNADGKVQPELFIAGEPNNFDVADKLKGLIETLESEQFNFKVPKDETTYEIKNMSGWTQLTVRGSNFTVVVDKFNELASQYPINK